MPPRKTNKRKKDSSEEKEVASTTHQETTYEPGKEEEKEDVAPPSKEKKQKKTKSSSTQSIVGLSRSYKMEVTDSWGLKINKIKPAFTYFLKGYSDSGLQLGSEKGGKPGALYLPLADRPAPADTPEEETSVKAFMKETDTYMKELWAEVQEDVFDKFDLAKKVRDSATVKFKDGWQEKELELYNVDPEEEDKKPIEMPIFPHATWTKLFRIKDGKIIPQKCTLHSQVDKRGNCVWTCRANIRTVVINYQPQRNIFVIRPFRNFDQIAYLDKGQDMTVDEEERERKAKEREERSMHDLLKASKSK